MEQQLQLHYQITKFLVNFRKLGRNNYTAALVRRRIRSLEVLWQQFNHGNAILASSTPKTEKGTVSYFKDNLYDDAEDAYNTALDHLAEILKELEPPSGSTRAHESTPTRSFQSSFTASHLPVIQMAPFDGDEDAWELFRDRFRAIVIENKELHDFARMHYLVSFLRGRALDCIAGLDIKPENFEVAWRMLKHEFDNKRRLISVHLSSILNAPRVTREREADLKALLRTYKLALLSLDKLQRSSADLWSDFLVHSMVQRLDHATHRAWTLHTCNTAEPSSYADLENFVADRIRSLSVFARDAPHGPSSRSGDAPRVHNANVAPPSQSGCPICRARHYFRSCPKFVSSNVAQRRDLVLKNTRCFNCLSPNHFIGECSRKHSCRKCHKRHHSLLHAPNPTENRSVVTAAPANSVPVDDRSDEPHALSASTSPPRRVPVMLATARVRVRLSHGRTAVVRALLDQGSEVTLITERLAQILRARLLRIGTSIRAVGGIVTGPIRCAVGLSISTPKSPSPSFDTTAVVLKSLTSYAPRYSFDLSKCKYLRGLDWADPDLFAHDPIDIIIGSDLYGPIQNAGAKRITVSSSSDEPLADDVSSFHCLEILHDDLKRFWQVEAVPGPPPLAPDDEKCETHFASTHSRTLEGRYRVRLPFKDDSPISIGSSRVRAARCFESLFRRLRLNPEHRQSYCDFLREYASLGHMTRVTDSANGDKPIVYLPHHPVFRNPGSSAGVRVVFNASSVTSNGTSLNDHLLIGPRLQSVLTAVILRWRTFRYVYCADIAKMYRQVLLDPRDVNHQRILWSECSPDAPDEFRLLTVTYGMACAPFLGLRVIQQLHQDEGHAYPLASNILQQHVYVDDVLFGGDTRAEAVCARDQLISLLSKGCFPLHKWASNLNALLADIPDEHCGSSGSCDLSSYDTVGPTCVGPYVAAH